MPNNSGSPEGVHSELWRGIVSIVAEYLKLPNSEIQPNHLLRDIDSADLIGIMLDVDDRFFDGREIINLQQNLPQDIGQLAQLVAKMVAEKQSGQSVDSND